MQKRCLSNLEKLQNQIDADSARITNNFDKVSENLKSLDAIAVAKQHLLIDSKKDQKNGDSTQENHNPTPLINHQSVNEQNLSFDEV